MDDRVDVTLPTSIKKSLRQRDIDFSISRVNGQGYRNDSLAVTFTKDRFVVATWYSATKTLRLADQRWGAADNLADAVKLLISAGESFTGGNFNLTPEPRKHSSSSPARRKQEVGGCMNFGVYPDESKTRPRFHEDHVDADVTDDAPEKT